MAAGHNMVANLLIIQISDPCNLLPFFYLISPNECTWTPLRLRGRQRRRAASGNVIFALASSAWFDQIHRGIS